jgi:hypothetical protein
MPHDLHALVLRAEGCAPSDCAPALLRLARVGAVHDQAEAERLLDRGLSMLSRLPDTDRLAMAPHAVCLAACVAPDRAFSLQRTIDSADRTDSFLVHMVAHGHSAVAVDYLARWSGEGPFPYRVAADVLRHAEDDQARRRILRSALLASRGADIEWRDLGDLIWLMRHRWHLLPQPEARDAVRALVRLIRETADRGGRMEIGGPLGTVTFSSHRSRLLFDLLGPLKRLDPQLADATVRGDTELARAAAIYPDGHDTDAPRPSERPSAESVEQWKRNWTGISLAAGFFRIEDEKNADFKSSFDRAFRSYARDADPAFPNPYPRECWPSAEDFRAILHAAGRHVGESGSRLLARVPDIVLRLFAEIEFVAGVTGLEHIGGITREQLRSR